jgi:hypothetical protein
MKRYLIASAAMFALLGGLGAAAPAGAQIQFAVFNPMSSATGGVADFSEDAMGHLTATSPSTPVLFMFDLTPLQVFGDLQSTFDFSATETGPATSGVIGGVSYTTASFDGSFDYYYSGPTVTHGSVTLTPGELLLHGDFTDAAFSARTGSSGGGLADDSLNGTVSFTSALPASVLPLGPTGQSFTIGFIDISPLVGVQGGLLRHFTGVGNGLFSSDLTSGGGGGVPEPVTWVLMLTGFAGIGGCLRRRTRVSGSPA